MLATLNLQLTSAEFLDDTLTTSASLLPEGDGGLESGFADLLRLRVDASQGSDLPGGDLLPQSGSELPLPPAITVPDVQNTVLSTAQLQTEAIADVPSPMASTDISLDMSVLYPPLNPALTVIPDAATVSLPVANSARPVSTVATASGAITDIADSLESRLPANEIPRPTRPEIAAQVQHVIETADGRVGTTPASLGLRERGQIGVPQTAVPSTVGVEQHLPEVDSSRRPEPVSLQRAEVLSEELTEVIRPRPVVIQAVPAPQMPLNTQGPQALFTAMPVNVAAGDVTYAAAAQQATDLIATPVRDSAWGERIGERVVWMAGNQLKTAEIRLTPAELGPIRVQVSVEDGATNVTFHAQHAVTREAIEQALPRLREMLAENGLSLGQADVGEQGVAEGNKDNQTEGSLSDGAADDLPGGVTDDDANQTPARMSSNGLVDTFA